MAMVGLLFVCLMVYKKTMVNTKCVKNENELNIQNALNLSARKTLYIIKAGNEKFLIASDVERTTFLAKLNNNEETTITQATPFVEEKRTEPKCVDYSEVMNAITTKRKQPVMKEILRKLDERAKENSK